jgi:predicted TIM-barrel fold metal-dependent hydrolase
MAPNPAQPDCDPPPGVQPPAAQLLPPGTCDAHFHVFGPQQLYPMDPRRGYTPHECGIADYREVMQAAGIARGVIVQPSVYGTDNRATLEGVRAGGAAFRAVVVPAGDISDDDLLAMHEAGARGIRLNLVNPQMVKVDDTLAIVHRMAAHGWHLQVQLDLARDPGSLAALCERVTVPVVVDHMGKLPPATRAHPLMDFLRAGVCWVKLSAPYRVSAQQSPHADLIGLVRAFADANPQRLVWGSDWPHTELHHGTPTIASIVAQVHTWFEDAAMRHQVCVANPAQLYGFGDWDKA